MTKPERLSKNEAVNTGLAEYSNTNASDAELAYDSKQYDLDAENNEIIHYNDFQDYPDSSEYYEEPNTWQVIDADMEYSNYLKDDPLFNKYGDVIDPYEDLPLSTYLNYYTAEQEGYEAYADYLSKYPQDDETPLGTPTAPVNIRVTPKDKARAEYQKRNTTRNARRDSGDNRTHDWEMINGKMGRYPIRNLRRLGRSASSYPLQGEEWDPFDVTDYDIEQALLNLESEHALQAYDAWVSANYADNLKMEQERQPRDFIIKVTDPNVPYDTEYKIPLCEAKLLGYKVPKWADGVVVQVKKESNDVWPPAVQSDQLNDTYSGNGYTVI